jgi:K(+)-stimulated pyrophosphate-energized sodium pump
LLVRGVGVLGSIISTYTVKAGADDTSDTALKSVHRGFWIGSIISIVGFFVIGVFYLYFDADYFKMYGMAAAGFPNGNPSELPFWANFGIANLDMRPAWTCLIGVFLAVALNKVTSYYTHTSHTPVKSLAQACQTGHATNIIQGFAVGYESTVASLLVIVAAVILSVLCYAGAPPVFVAYGVAMTGIGMLTLTGNTISMDVFGPVADNANGIGEMGYNKDDMGNDLAEGQPGYMAPADYKRARQILADLDAVGNTTKAETKGIAIGSAVIAAVSLFASFIAVIAVGSEDKLQTMTEAQYKYFSGFLTVADPKVLIGLLIGGAVPFLFSSMLIRAVGRAAFFIVKEVREQFKDPGIMARTKKPDYGRVVDICTSTAQKELIGPAILAILAPAAVGFLLGPYALGGFLAGMILVGQLLAVFMANAGGAWDNAKKMIEDEPRTETTGKGSEKHKAAVTGDTVGDPLKDTAGPAINPMVKVMNMVSLLGLGLVLAGNVAGIRPDVEAFRPEMSVTKVLPNLPTFWPVGILVVLVSVALILWAVYQSKHESAEMKEIVGGLDSSDTPEAGH